ncbi:unnamed protein product [Ectocarpus fasciculatus]
MAIEEDRAALSGLETRLFQLVSEKATSAQWAEWLRAPLEHAVAEGDKDLALTLLKAGANGGAGWKGCDDRTLLQAAAEGGNAEVVRTLLDLEEDCTPPCNRWWAHQCGTCADARRCQS